MAAGRRVALGCIEPLIEGHDYTPFSFGVRRVQAQLVAAPGLAAEVTLCESRSTDVDGWVERLLAVEADVVGLSAYVWSLPTFVEVARRLKRRRPAQVIVLGGPSARPAMLALPPFADAGGRHGIDALATADGELALRDLVALADRSPDGLATVGGLALPRGGAGPFVPTPVPAPEVVLDALPSPVQLGLVPPGRTVALETYRGCPLGCAFCQWGDADAPDKVFSAAYLRRELAALARADTPSVQLVDAGLNLNSRAFRHLVAAAADTGLFRRARLFTSIYPSHLTDEHLGFLAGLGRPARLDVGLQSFSRAVLDGLGRPFREARFVEVIEALTRIAEVEVEVILGLPGDGPASFRDTLARARALPCRVRVFHCLVLPDALLTRARAEDALDFDPVTLLMRSCRGWTAEALAATRDFVADEVARAGGEAGDGMWQFPDPVDARRRAERSGGAGAATVGTAAVGTARVAADLAAEVARAVAVGSDGRWRLLGVTRDRGRLLATVATVATAGASTGSPGPVAGTESASGGDAEALVLEAWAVGAGAPPPCFVLLDGVAFSYRAQRRSSRPGPPDGAVLGAVFARLRVALGDVPGEAVPRADDGAAGPPQTVAATVGGGGRRLLPVIADARAPAAGGDVVPAPPPVASRPAT